MSSLLFYNVKNKEKPTKLEAQNHLECYCMLYGYDFPSLGLRGPNYEKQTIIPPPPDFTVGTMHWGR
jgi:hypothetical protein